MLGVSCCSCGRRGTASATRVVHAAIRCERANGQASSSPSWDEAGGSLEYRVIGGHSAARRPHPSAQTYRGQGPVRVRAREGACLLFGCAEEERESKSMSHADPNTG